jgi:glutathione S-transferase
VRIEDEELNFMKKAGKLEFGQIPALEIEGRMYVQSMSILRMLGRKYGYYPEDVETGWRVDSTIDAAQDT